MNACFIDYYIALEIRSGEKARLASVASALLAVKFDRNDTNRTPLHATNDRRELVDSRR
jgi:hypothetical protein